MRRRGWSGSPHDQGLVDVELVDGPAGLAEPAEGSPTGFAEPALEIGAPRPGLRHRRLRWWAGAVAVAVVAVAVVGANVAEARRADARRATLADARGYVPTLAEPLREVWRVQGFSSGGTGNALLISTAQGMQAIDPASGEVLWTRPGAGQEYCPTVGVPMDPLTGLPVEATDGTAAPQLLACTDSYTGTADFGPVAVEIIDATTGQVRTTLTASGALLGMIPVERDVVIVLTTAEGHLRVARWDPATGEALVDETTAEPVVPAGTTPQGGWQVNDETMTVSAVRQVVLSLATGLELPAGDAPAEEWTTSVPMPDGAEAVWAYSQTDAGEGRVVEADGTVRFEFDGMPLSGHTGLTTDGSAPEVMIVMDDAFTHTTGLDARTGRELWTLETPSGQPTVQVDGVLVVIGPTVSTAVDVRDGRTQWSSPNGAGVYTSGITDGEVVLLVEAADPERLAEGQVVVARTIRDGAEVWRSPLPAGTSYVTTLPGGDVVGYDADGVFGLG